jgi:hypothetical protein
MWYGVRVVVFGLQTKEEIDFFIKKEDKLIFIAV